MDTFVFAATRWRVAAASTPVRAHPASNAKWVTEALFGEPLLLEQTSGKWSQVYLPMQPTHLHPSGYPGWVESSAVAPAGTMPTHQIVVPEALLNGDDEELGRLAMGALLVKESSAARDGGYVPIALGTGIVGWVSDKDVVAFPRARAGRSAVLDLLPSWTHQPYVWGGTSSINGVDCSGLVYRTYQAAGYLLPRDADDQFTSAPRKQFSAPDGAEPGDLAFFQKPASPTIDHVGLYLGDGKYLSASQAASGVSVRSVVSDGCVGWARYL